jgi:hypothetical protein
LICVSDPGFPFVGIRAAGVGRASALPFRRGQL